MTFLYHLSKIIFFVPMNKQKCDHNLVALCLNYLYKLNSSTIGIIIGLRFVLLNNNLPTLSRNS